MNEMQLSFDYGALDSETRDLVQRRTGEIKLLMKRTAQDIIEIGGKLFDVKARLEHGQFGGWLSAEFDWSYPTAARFMQVHDKFKSINLIDLSIPPSALYLLASPSVPQEARDEIIEAAGYGERVTVEQAKRVIAEHQISKAPPMLIEKLKDEAPAIFEQVRSGELTITQAKREHIRATAPEPPPFPTGKYRVIYADPPWSYGNTQPDYHPEQRDHYRVMNMDEICDMPIRDIAEDNAVLFLWVTSPILEEAFEVVRAWGFKYKSSFVWDKIKHNMGHYNSVRHELLLVCVRGSCQPDVLKLFDSVVSIERTEHSQKPEHFREIIDTIYPRGKRIELFARERHEGWETYGNEIG